MIYIRGTKPQTRPRAPLTPEQSRMAAEAYPRAMALVAWRAARLRVPDAVAETYRDSATAELLRAASTYAGSNGATFRSYAGRCIKLTLRNLDHLRFRSRAPRTVPIGGPGAGAGAGVEPPAPPPARDVEAADAFDALMAPLTEGQRAVLGLIYRDGLTAAEAAQRLGVGPSSVHAMKDRALATLRGHLERKGRTA